MNLAALRFRDAVLFGLPGVPTIIRARRLSMPHTRGELKAATVPDYLPDLHVRIIGVPPWLAWTIAACGVAGVGVGAWLAIETHENVKWTRSVAESIYQLNPQLVENPGDK